MFRSFKKKKELAKTVVSTVSSEELLTDSPGGETLDGSDKVEKKKKKKDKKAKKKKMKDSVPKPESSMTLLSTDSKVKKKKQKSSKSISSDKKKKPKKSKRKELEAAIPEEEEVIEEPTFKEATHPEPQQQNVDDKSDMMLSDGEASIQDANSDDQILSGNASLEDDINDEDDLDMLENQQMFDTGPPIGEILAGATDDDNVSDIGDAVGDGPPTTEVIDGVEIIYNPNDADVCFDDRHHPGTVDWIAVIRDCLGKFEGHEYSPPVYKAIKKQLKGRRFLVRTRRNERTSWREATKPEIIELFGEAFNEERRRIREGITDDDSGVDSSLQNSAAQSDASLSVGNIGDEIILPLQNGSEQPQPTPTSAPTPRVSNQAGGPSYDFGGDSDDDSQNENGRKRVANRTKSGSSTMSEKHLLQAMREIEDVADYARPFDDATLLQQGIAAEEKLNLLINLSDSSRTAALKAELDKLEELAKRMKIASMAPLLDVLTKLELHVTDYYNSMAEMHASSSSLQVTIDELTNGVSSKQFPTSSGKGARHLLALQNSRGSLEDDPRSDVDTERDISRSHQDPHIRSINIASDHGRKPDQSKSSRASAISSTPSKSKSKSHSRHSAELLNHSAVSLSTEDDEFGDALDGTQPTTASTEDVNSVPSEGDERMLSEAHLEAPEGTSHTDDKEFEQPLVDANESSNHAKEGNEQSIRSADFGGNYVEMELGGSSLGASGLVHVDASSRGSHSSASASEYSGQLQNEPKEDAQTYENSVRTADFGGSYREMALDGGYETSDDVGTTTEPDDLGESGLSSQLVADEDTHDNNVDDNKEEEEEEEEFVAEEGEYGLDDEEAPLDMAEGHVLDLRPSHSDDMSSMGRSVPGMYGSDSESDEDAEYEEYEVDEMDLEEEGDSESEVSESSDEYNEEKEHSEKGEKEEKPNPKLEQFFDRLQHFFEVRKKIAERADLMDPSAKLQSLKVKSHSGGIRKKNGNYKKEYQQRNLKNKIVRNLNDLYGPAELARDELSRLLSQLVGDVKGMDESSFSVAPLKQQNKAFDKAREEFFHRLPGPSESWLYDVARGSVYCKSYKQVADVNKWLSKNAHIVQSKNRFQQPCFNGYRDLLFHVSIPYQDDLAHICEVQVHHKDMKALDEQFGMPKHYEYFRSAFAGPWRTEEQVIEDLAMLNKYGEIGGQCMVKLLKSKDPDQLRLFARLCRDKLDEFDRALELYRRILLLQDDRIHDDHEDVADTYLGLGVVLGALGDIDESLLNLEKALAIKESSLGTEHLQVVEIYSMIGDMLRQKGDYGGALEKYKDTLRVRESNLGKRHFLVIRSLQDIGNVLRERGDFKGSESELRRALDMQEVVLGDSHVDVAATRSMLGTTLCEVGDYSRAMEEHRLALMIHETEVGKNNILTATSHTNIGTVLCQKGDYEVAEWRHRKALRIQEAVKGKDDEACAISLTHLGEVLKRKGDYDGAIKALKRACKIRENNLGMDHPISAGSHLDLGKVYVKRRKYDQALQEFRKAKVVRESFLGQRHPHTAEAYNYVGHALSLKGDHEAAITEHRRALAIYETVLGKSHPKTAMGYQFLADALFAKGDREDALIEHRRALAVRASVLNKDHPDTALSCSRIGVLMSQKGDLVGALVAFRQALAITVGLCGEDHPESATAHIEVGKVLAASGDIEEAMQEVQQALEVRESILGKDHPDTGRAHGVMGTLHSMSNEYTEAQESHKRCLGILERKLGKKNSSTKAARQRLVKAVEKKEDDNILGAY